MTVNSGGKSWVFVTQCVEMDFAKREKIVTVRSGVLTEIVTVRSGVLTEIVTVRSGVLTEIQKVCLPKIYKKYYYPT